MKINLFSCISHQKDYTSYIPVTKHLNENNYKEENEGIVIYAKYIHINTVRTMESFFVSPNISCLNYNEYKISEPFTKNEYLEYILNLENGYLFLFNSWEFLNMNTQFTNNLKVLLKRLNIPLNKVIVSSSYYNFKKKLDFKCFGFDYTFLREQENLKDIKEEEPNKYFTFLNRRYSKDRFDTLVFIYNNNFEDLGNITFLSLPPVPTQNPIEKLIPLQLDGDFNSVNWNETSNFNSYFLIINETLTDSNIIFLSEKIYKGIRTRKPFIVFGVSGILQALRDQGFKTFFPFIDESYDDIKDYDERFNLFLESINKLLLKSEKEMLEFKLETDSIVKHNFENLKTDRFNDFWGKIF